MLRDSRGPNREQFEYWNGPEGQHWVDREARFDSMLAGFVDPILDAAQIAAGDRVLDVGCGNGALSRAAAARGAAVTGVDISEPMLVRARARAAEDGLDVEFVHADAQTQRFGAEFEAVISRFGVMFFSDPERAFANLAAALRVGGRLAFACWQGVDVNEWVAVPSAAILPIVGPPEPPPPGSPGPFSLADPDRIASILRGVFADVTVEPLTQHVLLGGGLHTDDAVNWIAEGGMGKRLLGEADGPTRAQALAALGPALAPFDTAAGVRMHTAAWLVRARR